MAASSLWLQKHIVFYRRTNGFCELILTLADGKCEYSPMMWSDMLPQTKAYVTVTLVSTEMNQLDAGVLENMSFYIEIIEPNTYDLYLDIGPIVINMDNEPTSTVDTGL